MCLRKFEDITQLQKRNVKICDTVSEFLCENDRKGKKKKSRTKHNTEQSLSKRPVVAALMGSGSTGPRCS